MRCKTLTAAAVVLVMLTAGCSTFEKVVYRPDINRELPDVDRRGENSERDDPTTGRLHIGHPNAARPVRNSDVVLCVPPAARHEDITQQTLTLTFDSAGVLTDIQNKPALTK